MKIKFKEEFDKFDCESRRIVGIAYSEMGYYKLLAMNMTQLKERNIFSQTVGGCNDFDRVQNYDDVLDTEKIAYYSLLEYITKDFGPSLKISDEIAEKYFDLWLRGTMTCNEIMMTSFR